LEAHRGYLPVARGKHCYALYKTRVKVCWGWINFVEDDPSPNPWNHRLALMSEKGLKILVRESLISLSKGKKTSTLGIIIYLLSIIDLFFSNT